MISATQSDRARRFYLRIMSKHLERDLGYLQRSLVSAARFVERAIQKSLRSLHGRDPILAQEVIDEDFTIDLEEIHIEEECLKVLALHQPVAADLRRVMSILKMNLEIERIADLAESIAERSLNIQFGHAISIPADLRKMSDVATSMLRLAVDAFVDLNTELARTVCRLDDQVDEFESVIIAELVRLMKERAELVEPGLSLYAITRHIERIADHATNIAEDVMYLVQGKIVRHHAEAK